MSEEKTIQELQNICVDLKKHVVEMTYHAQSGHPGGSLSAADFVTACYFKVMNVDIDFNNFIKLEYDGYSKGWSLIEDTGRYYDGYKSGCYYIDSSSTKFTFSLIMDLDR